MLLRVQTGVCASHSLEMSQCRAGLVPASATIVVLAEIAGIVAVDLTLAVVNALAVTEPLEEASPLAERAWPAQ
jgi:hypothetical protein